MRSEIKSMYAPIFWLLFVNRATVPSRISKSPESNKKQRANKKQWQQINKQLIKPAKKAKNVIMFGVKKVPNGLPRILNNGCTCMRIFASIINLFLFPIFTTDNCINQNRNKGAEKTPDRNKPKCIKYICNK